MNTIKTRHQQRGATAIGMITIVAILGLGLYAVIMLAPVYLDYYEVVSTLNKVSKANSAETTSPDKLRDTLAKTWAVEYIDTLDYKDIEIRKVGSTFEITAEYRVERQFIGNVSLVADFYKSVTVE